MNITSNIFMNMIKNSWIKLTKMKEILLPNSYILLFYFKIKNYSKEKDTI